MEGERVKHRHKFETSISEEIDSAGWIGEPLQYVATIAHTYCACGAGSSVVITKRERIAA